MSRVAGGLRRLLGAPIWWLGSFVAVAALAMVVGTLVREMVAAAVGPFDGLDLDRVVFATVDVLRDHPSVAAGVVVAVASSAVISAIGWTLLSPLLIVRLAGHRDPAELGRRALPFVLPVAVQSLYHLVLRAIVVVAIVLSVQPLPGSIRWIPLALAWLLTGVALDATRVAVVEHDADPWHPRSALRGLVRAVKRPGLALPCAVLALGQTAITASILWLALAGYGEGASWGPRLLAVLSVGLGLWRLGIVIEDAELDPPA